MRILKYIICFVLCFVMVLPCIKAESVSAYSDGYTLIGDVSIPFAEYMPYTYFTKNGLACTCHDAAVDCVANGTACNCIRYATINGKSVDLLAVQCIGFARYCFYRIFGFIDHPQLNPNLYYNAGSLEYGAVTASSVEQLFAKLKPGAHIRFRLSGTEHSVILLSQNNLGFTVYQCNSGGNGVPQANCIVSTKTYTWQSFAEYAYRGVVFANMPVNYPDTLSYSQTPYHPIEKTAGIYTTTANLKLREGASTDTAWLDTIEAGTLIYVARLVGNWGSVFYNGREGYISLDYAMYTRELPTLASNTDGVYSSDGYLHGLAAGLTVEELAAMFDAATVSTLDEKVKTGSLVTVTNDNISYTLIAVVKGDINGDGDVSTADCAAMQGLLMGAEQRACFCLAADVNCDGLISTTDYQKLKHSLNSNTQEGNTDV